MKPGILFCDGCVLQRQKPITVWGEGTDADTVEVELAGNRASGTVKAGRWECTLPAMEAGRGLTMRITCGEETAVIRDVAVGEVWIAGGQSNMEYFLRYDAQWEDLCAEPVNPDIRMFNVARLAFPEQKKDVSDCGYWFDAADPAWPLFSAPGFAFARQLQPRLGVPVGIIGCNWGGTSASTWMDESYMEEEPLNIYLREYEAAVAGRDPEELIRLEKEAYRVDDDPVNTTAWAKMMYGSSLQEQAEWLEKAAADPAPENPMGPLHVGRPGRLYHQMLEKIIPFAARGVLWYQGESDECHAQIYDRLFAAMIRCFRDSFRQELPFLFVQLAPFGRWLECSGLQYPELRRRQEQVSRSVPGVHMVSIMDLGMYEDIHPKQKVEVGDRLARLAMGKIYGSTELCESPELLCACRTEEGIVLTFANTGEGLWESEPIPEAEAEAEQNGEYTGPAEMKDGFLVTSEENGGRGMTIQEVRPDGDRILLCIPDLPGQACRVSFAEVPYIRVRFFNSADLPLKPFSCVVE